MPARKRAKPSPAIDVDDPVKRFAEALRETELRDRQRREREKRQRAEAAEAARLAAEHEAELDAARADLDAAIEGSRQARRSGNGTADADARWRRAKSRVIELETGAPPGWAPVAE